MKMKKIVSKAIATLTIFSLLLTGCGKNVQVKGPIKLQLWLTPQWKGVMGPTEEGANYDSFFKHAATEFNKKNPNITVDVQVIPSEQRADKLNVCIQTKTLPDIFFDSTFAMSEFVHKGVMVPVTDIVDAASKKDIPKGIWENVTIGKDIYFYPFSHMPGTLVYNADMFKTAGLDKYIGTANEIVTWKFEDYKTILETLKSKLLGVAPMSLFAKNTQGDTWNLAYLRMYGSKFFDDNDKLVVNDEAGVKALTYLVDLYKSGLTVSGAESLSSNDCNAMFQNQKIAISFTNSVLYNNQLNDMKTGKTPKFDSRLANIPGKNGPLSFTYVTGSCVFDNGDKDRINAAKKFIEFYSSDPELVKASKNGLPVRDSVIPAVKNEIPLLEAYSKNAQYMFNFSRFVPGYLELRNALFPELQAALTGAKTPKEALDSYVNKGNAIIEKNKKESAIFNK